ncbi:MAG TPA: hypothetical protein PK867_12430 [Pirellulales bacterium]|nr:hypothetical protein [Pirellulales bacterium]
MPMLELSDEQVISLVKQLPPERQRAALLVLAHGATQTRSERMQYAESQLRHLCSERGLNWENMSEEDRENFVDDLVHEDRECGQ